MNSLKFSLFIFISFYPLLLSKTIYQCSQNIFLNRHCLHKWVDSFGNTRVDLKKCNPYYYCQILTNSKSITDETEGTCILNYRRKYHGDSCNNNPQCSSNFCKGGHCFGFSYKSLCSPNLFECQNNFVCKKFIEPSSYDNEKTVYRCSNLSQIYERCENDYECDLNLTCTNFFDINTIKDTDKNKILIENKEKLNSENYFEIKNKYFNETKICIERGSLENGVATNEEMACRSGVLLKGEDFLEGKEETFCGSRKEIIEGCNEENFCLVKVDLGILGNKTIKQECVFTTKGNSYCPLDEKENNWKNYLKMFNEYYLIKDVNKKRNISTKGIHIPIHKYTFNNKELMKAFWLYNRWNESLEGDECTENYFFIGNHSNKLKIKNIFNYLILFFGIAILL